MTPLELKLKSWIELNKLLYITIVKEKQGRKELWGRIISYDSQSKRLLFYLDDEKTICNINLFEIEDIIPSKK